MAKRKPTKREAEKMVRDQLDTSLRLVTSIQASLAEMVSIGKGDLSDEQWKTAVEAEKSLRASLFGVRRGIDDGNAALAAASALSAGFLAGRAERQIVNLQKVAEAVENAKAFLAATDEERDALIAAKRTNLDAEELEAIDKFNAEIVAMHEKMLLAVAERDAVVTARAIAGKIDPRKSLAKARQARSHKASERRRLAVKRFAEVLPTVGNNRKRAASLVADEFDAEPDSIRRWVAKARGDGRR